MKKRLTLFLENLTPDEFNKAFDNTVKAHSPYQDLALKKKYDTFRDALTSSFNWRQSPEGIDYWKDIYERNGLPQEEESIIPIKDAVSDYNFIFNKMLAYNEIIGLAQGYLDVIISNPDRAIELAENALEVIDLKYNQTKKHDKRNN